MRDVARLPENDRRDLFRAAAQKMRVHEAIVEKDFWVCWILDYLFHDYPSRDHFVFKGGTSLSKAFGAIDLEPKEPDANKHSDLTLARANMAARNGKRFQNFVEKLFFADHEVRPFLKARSRIIQLTDSGDGVLKIAEHRVIYEYHVEGNNRR
jgi:hypothetical protein